MYSARLLPAQKTPKNLYSTGSKLGLSAIEPTQIQELHGINFKTAFAPRDVAKRQRIHPNSQNIINLLKTDYPEIAEKSTTESEFLGKIINKFRKSMKKDMSHKIFASRVIDKISENPEIKGELQILKDKLYI